MRAALTFVTTFVLLVATARVYGQTEIYSDCNVAMCLGSSPTVSDAEYQIMAGAASQFARAVYRGHDKSSVAAGVYSDEVYLRHRCIPRTARESAQLFKCLYNVFAQTRSTVSTRLDACLETMCNHNSFYKNTVYRFKYDLVVITDSASYNKNRTVDWIDRCKRKGFAVLCVVVGTDAAVTNEYNDYCHEMRRVDDYAGVLRALDDLSTLTCTEPPVETLKVCKDATVLNAASYNAHPRRCDSSVKCTSAGGEINSIVEPCRCGMFWNQDVVSCLAVQQVNCPNDVCSLYNVENYGYTQNCRQYWDCGQGRTARALCCSDTEKYSNSLQGCVPDTNNECKDKCQCTFGNPPLANCDLRENKQDPQSYIQILWGTNAMVRPCARGTRFNVSSCRCDIHVFDPLIPEDPGCSVDFRILFTEKRLRDHGNDAYISNHGVTVDPVLKRGTFGGDDRLEVARFANYDWRNHFGFSIKFNDEGKTNNDAPLLSNQGCDLTKSVEVRLDKDAGNQAIVVCDLVTADFTYSLSAPYSTSQDTQVYASLRDEVFRLNVEYADGTAIKRTMTATGLVLPRNCPLSIGNGATNRFFHGRMMEVEVYIADCLPKKFI